MAVTVQRDYADQVLWNVAPLGDSIGNTAPPGGDGVGNASDILG
jgi:hypothetical protein